MGSYQLNLILLFPSSFMIGLNYFKPEEDFEYEEVNLYLGVVRFQFIWE